MTLCAQNLTMLSPSAAAWLEKIQNPQHDVSPSSLSSLSENEIFVISTFLDAKDLHFACQVSQSWKTLWSSLFLVLKIHLHPFLCNWSNVRRIINDFCHQKHDK